MIIGAVVYKLRALAGCKMPASHGRLVHATFLDLVRQYDVELSAVLHDSKTKSFALSPLLFEQEPKRNTYLVHQNDVVYWRVCGIGEELLKLLTSLELQTELRIGEGCFAIEDIYCDQDQHPDAGVTSMEYLAEACSQLPAMRSLTIEFNTPTFFRVNDLELPVPKPDLIFASLAERWNFFCWRLELNVNELKRQTEYFLPINWHGETKRYNITPKRGITGFVGEFTYDISRVDAEYRWQFILLAELAVFVGVGRLTAQGLGKVTVRYKE